MSALAAVVTAAYTALLAWGLFIGVRQIYQAHRRPSELLNPLFANPVALRLFTVHIVVVTADLFVIGPLAVAHKSTLYYWGGRILLLTSSLPVAAFFNRNPQSFGRFIGSWVKARNFFEYGLHVVVAALPVDWYRYYLLLWWIVAYRYLDVGPRRLLQRLYATPASQAERLWAQYVNWATIAGIYVGSFFAVFYQQVLYARVPAASVRPHVAAHWEVGAVVAVNLAFALYEWIMIRRYVDLRLEQRGPAPEGEVSAASY